MINKIKDWFFKGVILKKVAGKFVKHAVGALAALAASHSIVDDMGITIDWGQFETWAIVALAGVFGSAWNFIEHRFSKK